MAEGSGATTTPFHVLSQTVYATLCLAVNILHRPVVPAPRKVP